MGVLDAMAMNFLSKVVGGRRHCAFEMITPAGEGIGPPTLGRPTGCLPVGIRGRRCVAVSRSWIIPMQVFPNFTNDKRTEALRRQSGCGQCLASSPFCPRGRCRNPRRGRSYRGPFGNHAQGVIYTTDIFKPNGTLELQELSDCRILQSTLEKPSGVGHSRKMFAHFSLCGLFRVTPPTEHDAGCPIAKKSWQPCRCVDRGHLGRDLGENSRVSSWYSYHGQIHFHGSAT
jgi:hypothetical protein